MVLRARAVGSSMALDRGEVRRALAVLADPAHGCELRGLPSGRALVRPGSDLDGLVAAAEYLDGDLGIYYALNPVRADLDHACKVADVLHRRHLLIDVDAAKPKEHRDDSATQAEHDAALLLAASIREYLVGEGWPYPHVIDSGNGCHLVYRIDLANNEHSRVLLRQLLHRLAARFDSERGTIDTTVHNASRIARLPGTVARKGPNTAERPHRPCRLLDVREPAIIVRAEQIAAVVASLGSSSAELVAHECNSTEVAAHECPRVSDKGDTRPTGLKAKAVNPDPMGAWARSALEREAGRVAMATSPGRNNQLNASAFALGQIVAGGGLTRETVEQALAEAAHRCGLDQDPGCGPAGIEATIRSGLDSGAREPRTAPEAAGRPSGQKVAGPVATIEGPLILRASAVVPRRVEWLWPGRIPVGKLTTFAGMGGVGKTFVLCDLAARVSRGEEWPDTKGECAEPGQVLFVSGEDDPEDTLVPRLMELGADLHRVSFLSTTASGKFQLSDVAMLRAALREAQQVQPAVRFVAIDPPTAYLAGVDDHKNAELRTILTPLAQFAQQARVALVFNTHVNKGGAGKVEALARIMGSVAWVNAVRAAHIFAKDPDEPKRRLFVPAKINLAAERKGLAYEIVGTPNDGATLKWLGEVDTSADEALNRTGKEEKPTRKTAARDWLIERFREKREWQSEDLFRSAREAGVSRNAIFEAKNLLDLPKARKVSLENGDVAWTWWVPPDWAHFAREGSNTQTVGQLGELEESPF